MSEHKAEEMRGRLKEAVADIAGDKALRCEGKIGEAGAAIKGQIDKGADRLMDAVRLKSKSDKPAVS